MHEGFPLNVGARDASISLQEFLKEIDAIDNGVEICSGPGGPAYRINTNLSARVGRLNPRWNEPSGPEKENEQFRKAVTLTLSEFVEGATFYVESWLPARSIVEEAIKNAKEVCLCCVLSGFTDLLRLQVHPSGQIVKLGQYCPWAEHLFEVEKELRGSEETKADDGIKYVLYQDTAGKW